jgi:hypothetical protein
VADDSAPAAITLGFCLSCVDDHLSTVAPVVEAAVATGNSYRRTCGTVVVPDVAQVERVANGLDPTPGPGYPVRASDGVRSAWVATEAEP